MPLAEFRVLQALVSHEREPLENALVLNWKGKQITDAIQSEVEQRILLTRGVSAFCFPPHGSFASKNSQTIERDRPLRKRASQHL